MQIKYKMTSSQACQKRSRFFTGSGCSGRHEKGIALVVGLIVLAIMMLASVAILRNTGIGLGVAGNVGFKQNATSVADHGVESARAWLLSRSPSQLEIDSSNIYYATWDPTFSPSTYNWTNNSTESTSNDGTGNRVRYIVHRMCKIVGPIAASGQECVSASGAAGGNMVLNPDMPDSSPDTSATLYRVTVRVDGVRDTESYIQVMIR